MEVSHQAPYPDLGRRDVVEVAEEESGNQAAEETIGYRADEVIGKMNIRKIYPEGVAGLTDKYTDIGFDLNYEKSLGSNTITAHTT